MAKAKVFIVIKDGQIETVGLTGVDVDICVVDFDVQDIADEMTVVDTESFSGGFNDAVVKFIKTENKELKEELLTKAQELDEEFILEDDYVVAGFSLGDVNDVAVKSGYILSKRQLDDLAGSVAKNWDTNNSGSGWEQMENIVSLWADEKDVIQYDLHIVNDVDPVEGAEMFTDLGLCKFDGSNYILNDTVVSPKWFITDTVLPFEIVALTANISETGAITAGNYN